MARTLKNLSITVHVETEEGDEESWDLFFNYTLVRPGTYWDPPEGGEVEFLHAELRDPKGALVERMAFDDFCAKFDPEGKKLEAWDEEASMTEDDIDDGPESDDC
jgi:hypothetical protein